MTTYLTKAIPMIAVNIIFISAMIIALYTVIHPTTQQNIFKFMEVVGIGIIADFFLIFAQIHDWKIKETGVGSYWLKGNKKKVETNEQ